MGSSVSDVELRRNRGCAGNWEHGARLETGSHTLAIQSFARNQQDHQHEGARAQPAGRRRRHLCLGRPLHSQREGRRGAQRNCGRRWVAPSACAVPLLWLQIVVWKSVYAAEHVSATNKLRIQNRLLRSSTSAVGIFLLVKA